MTNNLPFSMLFLINISPNFPISSSGQFVNLSIFLFVVNNSLTLNLMGVFFYFNYSINSFKNGFILNDSKNSPKIYKFTVL